MWVCLNAAFLSIIEPPGDAGHLLVRARRAGDLQHVFPDCEVVQLDGRDYSFRTLLPRALVAQTIADCVTAIDYPNFKNSVKNEPLHRAYAQVWGVMARLQKRAPYARLCRPVAPAKAGAKRGVAAKPLPESAP